MVTFIELTDGTNTVTISGNKSSLAASTNEALSGWYSTPDTKVEMTERQAGHGAHNVTDDMVLYSARTVTIDVAALAGGRADLLTIMEQVQRFAGKVLTLRVVDGERDTYATGYLATEWDDARYENAQTGTITFVCADPRRYATEAHQALLSPMTGLDGGLVFDDNGCMVVNPVTFFGTTEAGNVAMLENNGTATAYPTITVSGYWPNGVTLNLGDGGQLAYAGSIYYQNLVIDCLTRTAAINGVDVTRNFTSRDFPSVEPNGSVRLSCMSAGNGSIEVTTRDTYI